MNLPLGFRYSAVYAGIRKAPRNDFALIAADEACPAAAVFTTNRVQAAPVQVGRDALRQSGGRVRAVMINAGNANCATRTGLPVARRTAAALARLLKAPPEQVIPSSTGVIGVELDAQLILNALPHAVAQLSPDCFPAAADAILTTDTMRKTAFAEVQGVRFAGMTKGAGMIHPGMATTLGFVMTDARIGVPALRRALRAAVNESYNCISVDGDMSTNDTLLVLASGASGRQLPEERFTAALTGLCQSLARQIARDGEGARKLIEIRVEGARSRADALRIARAIGNSPLVKTAIAGSDPNWGRILCAAGFSGAAFDPTAASIWLNGILVCRRGLAAEFDEAGLSRRLDNADCHIRLRLAGKGKGEARFWTCDFTHDYVTINASYRT